MWFNADPSREELGPNPDAGVQGCGDARPSGDPQASPPWVHGAVGTQSQAGGTHKGPSVWDKSRPVLPARGHPRDGREGPDPATAVAPSQPQGGGTRVPSLAPLAGSRRRVPGSPWVLRLRGSWAVLRHRAGVLRGEQTGCQPPQSHRAPRGNRGVSCVPPSAHLWGCRQAGRRGTVGTGQQGQTAGTRPWG